eukprot:1472011-Heterocapsa_arctica.AAC.1
MDRVPVEPPPECELEGDAPPAGFLISIASRRPRAPPTPRKWGLAGALIGHCSYRALRGDSARAGAVHPAVQGLLGEE